MNTTRIAVLLVAAAVTFPAAGLAAQSSFTPAKYRAQASALCVKASKQLASLGSAGDNASPSQVGSALSRALGMIRPMVAQFKALDPPASLRAAHQRAGASLDGLVSVAQTLADKLTGGASLEQALAAVAAPLTRLLATQKSVIAALGVPKCASLLSLAG